MRITRALLGIAAVAGAAGAFVLAWLPLSWSLSHFVIEDFGYYLTTARHAAAGHLIALDGEHVTNGFHPLWMVILVAVHKIFGDRPELIAHVALTILAAAFVATGLMLSRFVHQHVAQSLAIGIAAWTFLNYRLVTIPLGGLETALAGLAIVGATLLTVEWTDGLTPVRAVVLGSAVGLAYLARLDALLFGGIVVLWLAWRSWQARSGRQLWLSALTAFASGCWFVPWAIFSWRAVHAWLPRSGEAILTWNPSPWNPPWTVPRLEHAVRVAIVEPAGDVANLVGLWPVVNIAGIAQRNAALALGVFCVLCAALVWSVRRDQLLRRMVWIPVYCVCLTGYYLQFDLAIRYLYPAVLLMSLYVATAVAAAIRRSPQRGALVVNLAVLAAIAVGGIAGVQAARAGVATEGTHSAVSVFYEDLTPWLRVHTASDARIGAFNGGIVSYFSGRRVVNLDGVMNDSAIAAVRDGRLCEYVDRERLDRLVDNDEAIAFFFDRDASCVRSDWRRHWELLHRTEWPPDRAFNRTTFVVLARTETSR